MSSSQRLRRTAPVVAALALVLLPAAAGAEPLSREQARAVVEAADRVAADREKDARRHPVELLLFAEVGPGMRVADLGAGDGYTSELLARAVGEQGAVWSHNTPRVLEKYVKESWPARLGRDVNARVVRVVREFDDPLPAEADALDRITMIYVYHDTLHQDVDRAAMNRRLFEALAPGGALVVVDHHAKEGAGEEVGGTLHRIDAELLRRELEAAGFSLEAEGDFLRHPDDPREKPFFRMDGPTDAFAHRYRKPR